MQKHFVPNNTKECIIPIGDEIINALLKYCFTNAARGHLQNNIANNLSWNGYFVNYNIIDSLDNYMTRLQKLLDQRINKYHPEYNFHIYYGRYLLLHFFYLHWINYYPK